MFYVSKIAWFILQPSGFLLLVLLIGTALLWGRWYRLGRRLVLCAGLLLITASISPLGYALLLPLESRFSQPVETDAPARVDGIVVLGGATASHITRARNVVALNGAAERMTAAVALARRHEMARVVFAGGIANLSQKGMTEASAARLFFLQQGVSQERLVFEDRSRNTYENARNLKQLLQPKPGERWLLVTSAAHMPRSVGCFRKIGFEVQAWPVDYKTGGSRSLKWFFKRPSKGLTHVDGAVREWLGLLVYRLLGRTSALLPRA